MFNRYLMIGVALIVSTLAAWQASGWLFPPNTSVVLTFHAQVGDKPFQRNEFTYRNPGGEGEFRIRDFRFYLSNFRLTGANGQKIDLPDSYHLARFDNDASAYVLEFKELPIQELSQLSFAIGVDAAANTSIQSRGDLDPNSQMAWNWKVGYKFVLFEGTIKLDDQQMPLVYHVGFSDNMRRLQFDFSEAKSLGQGTRFDFDVDVLKLFDSNSTVNMAQLTSVKFDKSDARMLAENYRTMISLRDN